jgi:hypothetical protein
MYVRAYMYVAVYLYIYFKVHLKHLTNNINRAVRYLQEKSSVSSISDTHLGNNI